MHFFPSGPQRISLVRPGSVGRSGFEGASEGREEAAGAVSRTRQPERVMGWTGCTEDTVLGTAIHLPSFRPSASPRASTRPPVLPEQPVQDQVPNGGAGPYLARRMNGQRDGRSGRRRRRKDEDGGGRIRYQTATKVVRTRDFLIGDATAIPTT